MQDTDSTIVHFAAQTDSFFVLPTAVMAVSARENMKAGSSYHFHLFYEDLASWQIKLFEGLETPSFKVSLHEVINSRHTKFSKKLKVTSVSLVRLELPERLPNLDKVLYLDGDIIVHSDLTELYSTDLGQNYIAAVKDPYHYNHGDYVNQFPGNGYINSGVMLMNLAVLREEGVVDKFFEAKAHPEKFWRFQDQDVVNYCCANRIMYLHPRYNTLYWAYQLAEQGEITMYNKLYKTNYSSVAEIKFDAKISHLAGLHGNRPWDKSCAVFSELWFSYFLKTPAKHMNLSLKTPWDAIDQLQMTMERSKQRENHPAKQKESAPAKQGEPQTSIHVDKYGLSSWLPIITVRSSRNPLTQRIRTRVKLFGFIPLLSGRGYPDRMHWRLFNFIPVWRSEHKQLS